MQIEVSGIFRLLTKPDKGFYFDSNTKFFKAQDSQTIMKLNSNDRYRVEDILNTYGNSVSAIQLNWVDYKLTSGNSVFTMSENKISGNVTIDYLFISLPDPAFCPIVLTQINCQNNTVATYQRAATRCQSFNGCAKKGVCPLSVVKCPNGYNLASVPSKPNGCPRYYCDPSFLSN
ncbi:hypothetical protein DICPUDRAFT_93019 [Dictyostelium purpureum]|uniref:Uncharacterized protein n=1 Tax=Dictyostelium purpureum TaxID=5786 RepID=F1A0T2_DICPU|nr:uncharacterized protein DICPUDRAFT_93019 [Dictyostelium purpureum]EGC30213.1 hypothetical protein DICPUDRAFT_93019 [Dictyostelium purpureum]|eukprot:XP_003293276.1 hypothetical protein DICPUDRAFT_93019 [Dictyostelium purpureum]